MKHLERSNPYTLNMWKIINGKVSHYISHLTTYNWNI